MGQPAFSKAWESTPHAFDTISPHEFKFDQLREAADHRPRHAQIKSPPTPIPSLPPPPLHWMLLQAQACPIPPPPHTPSARLQITGQGMHKLRALLLLSLLCHPLPFIGCSYRPKPVQSPPPHTHLQRGCRSQAKACTN
jgi:hypothetical protein